jgi:DNA-binding NarL/FixJ family response regulator
MYYSNALSHREQEIASLFGAGATVNEIAGKLNLMTETVQLHLANIERKLAASDDRSSGATSEGKTRLAT